MDTNTVSNAIREGATSAACTDRWTYRVRDLGGLGAGRHAAQLKPAMSFVDAARGVVAEPTGFAIAETVPGTTLWSPPT